MSKPGKRVGIDTNILVYLINKTSVQNIPAHQLLKKLVKDQIKIIVTWQILSEFYAIVTDKKRFPNPRKPLEAVRYIKSLIDEAGFEIVLPNFETGRVFIILIQNIKPVGQKIHDIFLAATLISNGVEILITENVKDFEGISGLKAVGL